MKLNLKLKLARLVELNLMVLLLIMLLGCDRLYYAEIENKMDNPIQIIAIGEQFSKTDNIIVLDTIRTDKISYEMKGQSNYFIYESINKKISPEHIPFDSLIIISNQDTLFLNSPEEIFDKMDEDNGSRVLKITEL